MTETDHIAERSHRELWANLGCEPPRTHDDIMRFGQKQGWWTEFDDKGPVRVWYVDSAKFKFWSQILVELGFFKSIAEAKNRGWNKPLEIGTFVHFKGREKFIVE